MANVYLLIYNAASAAGWAYILYLTALNILAEESVGSLWKTVEAPLKIFQTSAGLEILHSAVKLVRSPLIVTTLQVFSRLWIVWGIINPVQFATTTQSLTLINLGGGLKIELGLKSLILAWSLAEIIRYSFFALKELHVDSFLSKWLRYTGFILLYPLGVSSELSVVYLAMPYIKTSHMWSLHMPNLINFAFSYHEVGMESALLKWLRYTVFVPLYPIGVGSELALVYMALPAIRDLGLWTLSMPNPVNFAFDYYIYVIVYSLLYLPFFPQLYLYMLAQRRKVLGAKERRAD